MNKHILTTVSSSWGRVGWLSLSLLVSAGTNTMGSTLTETSAIYAREIILTGDQAHKALRLPPSVLNHAGTSSLRIVNQTTGEYVPFFLHTGAALDSTMAESQTWDMELVRTTVHEQYYTQDFQVSGAGWDMDVLLTHVDVGSEDGDFLRQVSLFGSNDDQHWELLTEYQVYRVGQVAQTRLELGDVQRFRYYRLRVPTPQDLVVFSLQGYHLGEPTSTTPRTAEQAARFSVETVDNRSRVTIAGLSDGATLANLPLVSVSITSPDMFQRDVWRGHHLSMYTLHQFMFEGALIQQTQFPTPEQVTTSETFVFEIVDNDNLPLNIEAVAVAYRQYYAVFEASPAGSYALHYGGGLPAPVYDIEHFRGLIVAQGYDVVAVSATRQLVQVAETVVGSQDFTLLFNLAMVAASALLGVVGLSSFLKSRQPKSKAP